jgi:predicted membrane protein
MVRGGSRRRGWYGHSETFPGSTETSTSPHLQHSSVFGDTRFKVESAEFSGGSVHHVFGNITIDLTAVETITGEGHLKLDSVFGDIIVRIPAHMAYSVGGSSVFGSFITPEGARLHAREYRSDGFETASERLGIKASQVFGNLEVIRQDDPG